MLSRFNKLLIVAMLLLVGTAGIASVILLQPPSPAPASDVAGITSVAGTKVVSVIDGSTLSVLLDDGDAHIVKLVGIAAFDTTPACSGASAKARGESLFSAAGVSLTADPILPDKDIFGRLLRYVFLSDGTSYNKLLLAEGLMRPQIPQGADSYLLQNEFQQAADQARSARRGLWATCNGR